MVGDRRRAVYLLDSPVHISLFTREGETVQDPNADLGFKQALR